MIDSYTCDDKGFTPVHAGVVAGYVRTYSLLSVPSSSCQMILVMLWKCAPYASKSMRNCKYLEDVLSIYTQSSKCITLRTFPLRPLSPPTLLTLCRSAACVAILLEMGFRPDYPNSYKQTPLVRTNIFLFLSLLHVSTLKFLCVQILSHTSNSFSSHDLSNLKILSYFRIWHIGQDLQQWLECWSPRSVITKMLIVIIIAGRLL